MPEDKFIADAERAEEEARAARAANLFDVRRIIGGLFLIYGVILFVLGIGASDAESREGGRGQRQPVDRPGDAGRRRAVHRLGALAPARGRSWPRPRPSQSRRAAGPGATDTARRAARAGRQEREHGAAEAAADHAGAGGARVLERRHRALDLGNGRLVVVAQAGVRGVEQPRRRARGRRRRAPRPSRRRARSRSGRGARGGPAARAGRRRRPRVAQAGDPERLAGRGALARGARCSRRRRARASRPSRA